MTSSFEDLTDYYRQSGLFKSLHAEFEAKVAGLPRDRHDVPLAGTFPKKKARRPSIFEEYLSKSPEKLITKSTIPVAEKFPNDSSTYKLALDNKEKTGKTIYQMEKERTYNNPEMLRFLYGFASSNQDQNIPQSCVDVMEIGRNGTSVRRNLQTEELINFYERNDGVKDFNRNLVEYPPSEELAPRAERASSENPSTVLRIFVTPDSKEEILTITSPVPGDEFTDSGIENNGNFQSPTTSSVDYSPRSDRFDERPLSRKTVTFDLDTSKSNPKLDQVVIGLRLDENRPGKVKETAAKFDSIRVQSASPRSEKSVQAKPENSPVPKTEAHVVEIGKKLTKGTRQVALGIELCREQKGHVTACKFPLRRSHESVFLSASSPPTAPVLQKSNEMVFTQLASLKTVDIPLGGPLPDNNGIMVLNLEIENGPNGRHDFGFTVSGGKDRHEPVTIEKVMVDSAADSAGLQVGDHILDINGESVIEKYHKTVKRMISEATWVGAIEVRIRRPSYVYGTMNGHSKANGSIPTGQGVDYSTASFNEKRTMFDQSERDANSYAQFVQKKKMQTPSKWNNEPRRTYTREVPTDALPDRTYSPSMSSVSPQSSHEYRTSTLESNISLGSTKSYHDYRVTAIHDKPDPGKLTDFIPEVERGAINKVSYLDGHNSNQYSDQPKLIRNYNYNIVKSNFDIPPTQPSHNNNNNAAAKEKIHKWVNSSSLPREARNHAQHEDNVDDDTQPGRSFLRKHLRQVNPLLEDERSSNQIPKESNRDGQYANIRDFQRRQPSPAVKESPIYAVPPKVAEQLTRRSRSTEPFAPERREKEIPIQRGTVTYETRTVPYERQIPIRLTGHPSSFKFKRDMPQEEHRYETPEDEISEPSHRFYDREMQEMGSGGGGFRARSVEDLLTRREREVIHSPQAPTLTEIMDAKEWRHVIREQRLPQPGNPYSKGSYDNNPKFGVVQKSVGSMKDLRPVNGTLPKMTERSIADAVSKTTSMHDVHAPEEPKSEPPMPTETTNAAGEKLFAVSGRHRCAHCSQELGRGAAMIIESLKLFYHLSCFRCFVCNMALGNGTQGADVRVRGSKLHCQRCYSNDENGKFSRI